MPGDEIGVKRGNVFYLDSNGNGRWDGIGDAKDTKIYFGLESGDVGISGDWNNDGTDEIGIKRGERFYLDFNGDGRWNGPSIDRRYVFGNSVGDEPVIGRWEAGGGDRIGIKRGSRFYLDRNGDGRWSGIGEGNDVMYSFGAINDTGIAGNWREPSLLQATQTSAERPNVATSTEPELSPIVSASTSNSLHAPSSMNEVTEIDVQRDVAVSNVELFFQTSPSAGASRGDSVEYADSPQSNDPTRQVDDLYFAIGDAMASDQLDLLALVVDDLSFLAD